MNEAGYKLLKDFEGFEPEAYWDKYGKIWTIGWGFTKGVKDGDTMTEEEGNERLRQEIQEYERGVLRLCTLEPNENQLSAMVCLAWNIGLHPKKGFPISAVLRYHNLGDFKKAADSFKSWQKSGGIELPGLVRRRKAEAALYLKEL